MTPNERDRLRASASAVPKPWLWWCRGGSLLASVDGPALAYVHATKDLSHCISTGAYLGAVNPGVVIDLLDCVELLAAALAHMRACRGCGEMDLGECGRPEIVELRDLLTLKMGPR